MRLHSLLPLSALLVFCTLQMLLHSALLPSADLLLSTLQQHLSDHLLLFAFLIILLESIIYLGFYFPGQFFAVLLVLTSQPSATNIGALTLAMVAAATTGSLFNYMLGRQMAYTDGNGQPVERRQLLLAMIHINALAFFMFHQGRNRRSPAVIALAGLLNLPYYGLLIALTLLLSEQVGSLAENSKILFGLLLSWLMVAIWWDIKAAKGQTAEQSG